MWVASASAHSGLPVSQRPGSPKQAVFWWWLSCLACCSQAYITMRVLLCLAALLAVVRPGLGLPRGVDPAHAVSYSGPQTFSCLDGSKQIMFERVNDDFCDCADGSDEPGTAACYYGRFWCANRGHEPQLLSSSFVDDGHCDCCDGSDEAYTPCNNTCLEKSSTEREARRGKVEQMQRALQLKLALITEAAAKRASWAARSGVVSSDITQQQQEVQRLEGAKVQAEAAAEVDRQRLAAEQEADRQRVVAEQEAERQRLASEVEAAAAAQPAEGTPEQAPELEETDEERGRRIASQWTQDPDAAAVQSEDNVVDGEDAEATEGDDSQEEFDGDDRHPHDPHNDHHQPPYHQQHVYTPLDADVHVAKTSWEAAKQRLTELVNERAEIERYHNSGATYDWGPDGMFASLAGRCILESGTRWIYEACFFDKATQKEPHNASNAVSLGTWSGFTPGYKKAIFLNGDACQGAPNRSFTVTLVCGEQEQLYNSEEPGTCVYRAYLVTPLACSEADLEKEVKHLRELESFEAQVRAEIEAAAQAKLAAHVEL